MLLRVLYALGNCIQYEILLGGVTLTDSLPGDALKVDSGEFGGEARWICERAGGVRVGLGLAFQEMRCWQKWWMS